MLLKDKVALITGTSRGIGREIVEHYAFNSAIVYANARTPGCLDEYSDVSNSKFNGRVIPLYFDVTDINACKQAILRIKREQGKLDVLVNNAGIMQDALIGMITNEMINNVFNTNVFAVISLIQLASKIMIKQKSGSIINISSIMGVEGNKGKLVYSGSKGAIISITKSAAKELAEHMIRVNAIAPGIIDTDMLRSIDSKHKQEYISRIGLGRIGTPKDIADACVFLASDLSGYISGQVIGIDGCVAL